MRHAFIVGSPRSGTTWLQMMLSAHPSVASGRETHVFSRYITNIMAIIKYDLRQPSLNGVAKLIGEEDVKNYCKQLADKCFSKFLEDTPDAKIILEKTPNHIRFYETILKFYPNCYFIQVIRDPRGVVSSMRAAGGTDWGRHWAPTDVVEAANRWLADTHKEVEIKRATQNYRLVRYEDLHTHGPEVLNGLFDWMGLDATPELCHDIFESLSLDRVREKTTPERAGYNNETRNAFFREGKTDTWRNDLTSSEVRAIEYICRNQMHPHGYSLTTTNRSKPFCVRSHAFRQGLKKRIKKWSKKMEKRL